MGGYSSPLLDQYNRDGIVTPQLKRVQATVAQRLAALQPAPAPGQPPGVPAAVSSAPNPGLTPPMEPPPTLGSAGPSPGLVRTLGQPPAHNPLGAPPAPPPAAPTPHQQELERLTTGETGKSGIAQIHNPWIRTPLQVLDAIGSTFAPTLTMGLPGTQLHHQMLVNAATRAVGNDEAQRAAADASRLRTAQSVKTEAEPAMEQASQDLKERELGQKASQFEAEEPLRKAQIEHLGAQTESLQNPVTKENVHVLPDGKVISVHTDPSTGKARAEVVYEGDPKVQAKVTQLEIGGEPHTVLVNESTGETIKDLGKSGQKQPVVNVNAQTNMLDRESSRFAKSHETAATAASAQLEKIAEARAMVNGSAEAQALGIPKVLTALVSGQGTGVRITQAELNSIARARGISGNIEGFLSNISGKGALSTEQKRQLTGVLDDVASRVKQKQAIHNEALDAINGARSREEIIGHDKAFRKKLADMESGGTAPAAPSSPGVIVQQSPSTGQYRHSTDGGKTWQPGKPPR